MPKLWRMTVKVNNNGYGQTTYTTQLLIISSTEEEAKAKAKEWWLHNKEWVKRDKGKSLFGFSAINGDFEFVGVEKVWCHGQKDVYRI